LPKLEAADKAHRDLWSQAMAAAERSGGVEDLTCFDAHCEAFNALVHLVNSQATKPEPAPPVEHQGSGDRPLLHNSRSFTVPQDRWERFRDSIDTFQQVEDAILPSEVRDAIVESAEGARDSIRTEVPVSGEVNPWQDRRPDEDCSVEIVKAAGEVDLLQDLLQKDYGGLTDPKRRPEVYPGLLPLTKEAIDRFVGSTAELRRCFTEWGVPDEAEVEVPSDSKPAEVKDQGGRMEQAPIEYLMNWREILDELKQKNDQEKRNRIRRLNDMHGGPIIFPGQGAQPTVDKAKLIAWWNGLEKRLRELEQQQADREATVADQYKHGADGIVVPGIIGGVRKRRKDQKS